MFIYYIQMYTYINNPFVHFILFCISFTVLDVGIILLTWLYENVLDRVYISGVAECLPPGANLKFYAPL